MFGSPGAVLFPPPAEQLEASESCDVCDWTGTAFIWPAVAALAGLETPIGCRRDVCPDCGASLDPRRRHPSSGGS